MNQEKIQQKIADLIDDSVECGCQLFQNYNPGEQVGSAAGQVEDFIKKHPIKAVVAGLCSGFIIGKILR